MSYRTDLIASIIETIPNIKIIKSFVDFNGNVLGRVYLQQLEVELEFEVEIKPPYPLQFHETESIRFINQSLIEYNHVNRDGSICIHTSHSHDIKQKLHWDFDSLKHWVKEYYIDNREDKHYEHIVVNEFQEEILSRFLFTDVNFRFLKHSFGFFNYTLQANGFVGNQKCNTYLIHSFIIGKAPYPICQWSKPYIENRNFLKGAFVFIENAPVENKRFAVERWDELESFVSQDFLKFLDKIKKEGLLKKFGRQIPLLVGYKLPTDEIHWQCAFIDCDNFPNQSKPMGNNWGGELKKMPIKWSSTQNCSYEYFFGRGKFSDKITSKRILIIGIGAVGSIVATTLTRCGCRFLSLVDYDVKEPVNVCRSEYDFATGITNKVEDLGLKLLRISPFVEIVPDSIMMDAIKYFVHNNAMLETIKNQIEKYDLIIDCTTDDDVAYILDKLDLQSQVVSLSITNNAKELLCSVNPNLYDWLINRDRFLEKSDEPLHEPTGCWSPTFKASYNDVNVLVQFALKHINNTMASGIELRHFYLRAENEHGFNIKLNQF